MHATVAECEASQAHWNSEVALACGGKVWEDHGLRWSWQPHNRHLMLNFPRAVDPSAVRSGIEFAREHKACIVGAWLSSDTDATVLEAAGFDRGWEPWWMAAPLDAIPEPDDPRAELTADVPEYGPEGQRLLSLARGDPPRAWHVAARVEGRFAGRAWSIASGEVAGIYDMEVWPQFQRRGLGRALLRAGCAAARKAGATRAVLNATSDGESLYSAEGFARVGTGITYWHHLTRTG